MKAGSRRVWADPDFSVLPLPGKVTAMARRRRSSSGSAEKRGVFTQGQFSALQSTANRCRNKMLGVRLRKVTTTSDECLRVFVQEEHRDVLRQAGQLFTSRDMHYLTVGVQGRYSNNFTGLLVRPMSYMVRTSKPGFIVPDYADGRRTSPSRREVELPEHLQRYVDGRLSLAVEFGLLDAILSWFADKHLLIPQMAYLFPPIIQLLSVDQSTKKFAENYKAKIPNYIPTPPGLPAVFSLVESTLMKVLMVLDEPSTTSGGNELMVDAGFPDSGINFMGWNIDLK